MTDVICPARYPAVDSFARISWGLHGIDPCDWCGRRASGFWTPEDSVLWLCDGCLDAWDNL